MEPNEHLARFLEAVRAANEAYDRYAPKSHQATAWENAANQAVELVEWLVAGGTTPNWKKQWERHQVAEWSNNGGY